MQRLTSDAIAEAETTLGVTLAAFYKKLLIEVGVGVFGQRSDCKWNTTSELYHPLAVRELYDSFFDDPRILFAPYFPFGCNNDTQELWVIDAASERSASIPHDTHPDDWSEAEWLAYPDWEQRFLGGEVR